MWKIKSSYLAKCGLLVLSTAVTVLVGEILLRSVYPAPYYGYESMAPQGRFFEYDPVLGWKGRPGARGMFAGPDFHVSVAHDRYGFRNATSPVLHDRQNILVLGDSYGWGWGVSDEDIFSSYIVQNSPRINAYNLSAPGYGTDQEYITLVRFLEQNDHAAYSGVFLLFYFNDFQDVLATVRYSYPKPRFVLHNKTLLLENVPVPDVKKHEYDNPRSDAILLSPSILRNLHTYNLAMHRGAWALQGITRALSRNGGAEAGPTQTGVVRTDRELTLGLLKEIDGLCKKDGMFFHVVVMMTSTTNEAWRQQLRGLAAGMSDSQIEHSYFSSRVLPSTDLWIDGHLSKYGHKLLASHILEILRKKGIGA